MSGLAHTLIDPFQSFAFMRTALVACLALALANGPLGTLLLLRRMSLDGDVLSHAVMPGAALGFLYAGYSLAALSLGGLLTGALVAASAGLVARWQPKRKEASLAAFYLVSLALGVTLVSLKGSSIDLLHVLFGSALSLDDAALYLLAGVASLTLALLAIFYRALVLDTLDPVFLRRASPWGEFIPFLFLALVVLNLVAGFQALGTLMAVGLMMLPAAAARLLARDFSTTLALAALIGAACAYAGLIFSYHSGAPTGPSIVLCAGLAYFLALGFGPKRESATRR
jgi:zinc/manganese transport system permease protein